MRFLVKISFIEKHIIWILFWLKIKKYIIEILPIAICISSWENRFFLKIYTTYRKTDRQTIITINYICYSKREKSLLCLVLFVVGY